MPAMKPSKRSTKRGSCGVFLAKGLVSSGCSVMNTGWMSLGSTHSLNSSSTCVPQVGAGVDGLVEPLLPDARLQVGHRARVVGADVDAGLLLDGLAHGEARPRRREVDLVAAEVHLEAADGASRLGDHLLHHRHDVVVVHVGLVRLEHGELGVVLEAHALVAEVLADLVHAVDAADDAALEVQLGGDAQVQVALELVVVRDERLGQGAAVERLQHRRLDLDEAARVEEAADGGDDPRALEEHLARVVVGDQVEVALAVARLDVGEAVVLLGQRAQRLAEQLPGR